jgi:hypothetical protein
MTKTIMPGMTKTIMPTLQPRPDSAKGRSHHRVLQSREWIETTFTFTAQKNPHHGQILNQKEVRVILNKDMIISGKTMNRY